MHYCHTSFAVSHKLVQTAASIRLRLLGCCSTLYCFVARYRSCGCRSPFPLQMFRATSQTLNNFEVAVPSFKSVMGLENRTARKGPILGARSQRIRVQGPSQKTCYHVELVEKTQERTRSPKGARDPTPKLWQRKPNGSQVCYQVQILEKHRSPQGAQQEPMPKLW